MAQAALERNLRPYRPQFPTALNRLAFALAPRVITAGLGIAAVNSGFGVVGLWFALAGVLRIAGTLVNRFVPELGERS
jgi:hypothetical protein